MDGRVVDGMHTPIADDGLDTLQLLRSVSEALDVGRLESCR